jgi:hypothetical protein
MEGVIVKGELEPAFERALNERWKGSNGRELFEGSPKPFDEPDRADSPDGAESLTNAEFLELLAEGLGHELASPVADEMAGSAVSPNGMVQEPEHVFGGRLLSKDAGGDGKPRDGIEDEGELEAEESEEARGTSARSTRKTWFGNRAWRARRSEARSASSAGFGAVSL